jgi:hypothetical protein
MALPAPLPAGPLEQIRALAKVSPSVNLDRLKKGQIICTRGDLGKFPRGISLQSCYFIHAPMPAVGNALLHWDPLQHQDLEVRLYREHSLPAAADVFRRLRLESRFPDDRWLLQQTARAAENGSAGELHLTSEEVALLRQKKNQPNVAWQEILRRRCDALARGGLAAVPPYGADKSISPASEYRGLLSLVPKAAQFFRPITEAAPLRAGAKPASETVGYWETTKLRDHTTLQLGVFAAQKGTDSWQLVDVVYYPSDTYYMALDLFQLWPVDGGTLVWQVGLASAPFQTFLAGIDRYFAGKIMTQETLATIKAFRGYLEKGR